MTVRTVLIDTDILRYSHGSINMRHPFLEGVFIPASSEQVCELVDDLIQSVVKRTKASDYLCILSGKGNFRNEVAKQAVYKGNRDPNLQRPAHFKTVEEHVKNNHPFIETSGNEADDHIGKIQYDDWKKVFEKHGFDFKPDELSYVIASRDKDLRTIQGWHYSWACGEKQPEKPLYYISPSKSMWMLFYQMLIGDSTDNIVGCGVKTLAKWGFKKDEDGKVLLDEQGEKVPNMILRRKGIGEKAAKGILEKCKTVGDMKDAVFTKYIEMFKDTHEELLLENARLLFIGQDADNLFEWSWLDKYMGLENEEYIADTNVVESSERGITPTADDTDRESLNETELLNPEESPNI